MMDDVKFSDHWYIDIPCYTILFTLVVSSMLFLMVASELSLDRLILHYLQIPYLKLWVAPIVEECFKFLALVLGYSFGLAFTIIFAIGEFWKFTIWAFNTHNDTPTFFIMRTLAMSVHFITLYFQYFGMKMYRKYNSWVLLLMGLTAAIFFHFEWNTVVGRFVYINVLDWYSDLRLYLGL